MLISIKLMAQPAIPNPTNYNYFLTQNFNVTIFNFNNLPESPQPNDDQQLKMTSRQAIYAFIVTVLLNLVQIKYQSKPASPFETHPQTMVAAVVSLLLYYYLSYFAKPRTIRPSSAQPNYSSRTAYLDCFSKMGLGLCGPLSLASILSVILPPSLCPVVFSASLLFSVFQMIPQSYVETTWNMAAKVATYVYERFCGQPYSLRRRVGGIQVQLPNWLQQRTSTAISNHVGILPR